MLCTTCPTAVRCPTLDYTDPLTNKQWQFVILGLPMESGPTINDATGTGCKVNCRLESIKTTTDQKYFLVERSDTRTPKYDVFHNVITINTVPEQHSTLRCPSEPGCGELLLSYDDETFWKVLGQEKSYCAVCFKRQFSQSGDKMAVVCSTHGCRASRHRACFNGAFTDAQLAAGRFLCDRCMAREEAPPAQPKRQSHVPTPKAKGKDHQSHVPTPKVLSSSAGIVRRPVPPPSIAYDLQAGIAASTLAFQGESNRHQPPPLTAEDHALLVTRTCQLLSACGAKVTKLRDMPGDGNCMFHAAAYCAEQNRFVEGLRQSFPEDAAQRTQPFDASTIRRHLGQWVRRANGYKVLDQPLTPTPHRTSICVAFQRHIDECTGRVTMRTPISMEQFSRLLDNDTSIWRRIDIVPDSDRTEGDLFDYMPKILAHAYPIRVIVVMMSMVNLAPVDSRPGQPISHPAIQEFKETHEPIGTIYLVQNRAQDHYLAPDFATRQAPMVRDDGPSSLPSTLINGRPSSRLPPSALFARFNAPSIGTPCIAEVAPAADPVDECSSEDISQPLEDTPERETGQLSDDPPGFWSMGSGPWVLVMGSGPWVLAGPWVLVHGFCVAFR